MQDSQGQPLQPSPTARETPDASGLGRTGGQRTAEIFAGLRAELMPSAETHALSLRSGRMMAKLMMRVARPKILNFVPIRLGGFTGLIQQSIPQNTTSDITIVEMGAGFSPRGLHLARLMPHALVIEIDLPDVIEEKQKRLSQIAGFTPPSNLLWRSADLGITPLAEVLEGEPADVVTAEGLLPYFPLDEITNIGKSVRASLKPNGKFIADIGYTTPQGAQQAGQIMKMFSRQTRTNPGSVTDPEIARQAFVDAEFSQVQMYSMPEVAEMYSLLQPAPDVLLFMVGHK